MLEDEINIFIDCLEEYFLKKSGQQVIVESPHLTESVYDRLLDFSSVISISGAYVGNMYFTANHQFVEQLIAIHNQNDFSDRMKMDAVGEVANTLSGNVRKSLGSRFVISVPQAIDDIYVNDSELESIAHAYVIPMKWQEHSAALLVNIIKS